MQTSAACLPRLNLSTSLPPSPPTLPAFLLLMLKEIFIVSHISYSLCSPTLTTLRCVWESEYRWVYAIHACAGLLACKKMPMVCIFPPFSPSLCVSVCVCVGVCSVCTRLLYSILSSYPYSHPQSYPYSSRWHPWVSKYSLISWNLFETSKWEAGNEVVPGLSLCLLMSDSWGEWRVGLGGLFDLRTRGYWGRRRREAMRDGCGRWTWVKWRCGWWWR